MKEREKRKTRDDTRKSLSFLRLELRNKIILARMTSKKCKEKFLSCPLRVNASLQVFIF